MSASQASALRLLAEPIVAAADCDLEDIVIRQAGKRRLVRVVVDHNEGELTLDLVASISRDIARVLDDSTILGQAPYVLEVTSPGVDRPLRTPRHWHRAVGRVVLVTPKSGPAVEGRVLTADDVRAILEVESVPTPVVYEAVARATVQVEFTRLEDVDLDTEEGDAEPDDDGLSDPVDAGSQDAEPAAAPGPRVRHPDLKEG